MKAFDRKLREAWRLRMDQSIEPCREIASDLLRELTPLVEPKAADLLELGRPGLEWLLLEASLARADGELSRSGEILDAISRHCRARREPVPFRLPFERGLNHMVRGDYTEALEGFLSAKDRATSGAEKLYALVNTAFCLNNLGLDCDECLREFRETWREAHASELRGVHEQFEAFARRLAFRRGDIASALGRAGEVGGQAEYYRLWVAELPYHAQYRACGAKETERFSLASPYFHEKRYRLRTLQGILHPDDKTRFKATELADRLYLWTWRWITDPEHFPPDRLGALLETVNPDELALRMSAEDFQLVRNSLSWLGLFSPAHTAPARRLLHRLMPARLAEYPLLELEHRLIGYLLAIRDGKDAEANALWIALRQHPLWGSKALRFAELVARARGEMAAGSPDDPMATLARRLARPSGRERAGRKTLEIDLASFRLTPRNGRALISPALCRALELLRAKNCVAPAELLASSHGLARYDSEIHAPRLYNLLARLKKCAPEGFRFQVKEGLVYVSGDWTLVAFLRPDSMSRSLGEQEGWKRLVRAPSPTRRETRSAPRGWIAKLPRDSFTRSDIERLGGLSRASAVRLLARWEKEGKVTRDGRGKSTRYRLD